MLEIDFDEIEHTFEIDGLTITISRMSIDERMERDLKLAEIGRNHGESLQRLGELAEANKDGITLGDIADKYPDLSGVIPLQNLNKEMYFKHVLKIQGVSVKNGSGPKLLDDEKAKQLIWDRKAKIRNKIIDKIQGVLSEKDKKTLYGLVGSENLWEKRIAIISCFAFIKKNEFGDALTISELLMKDKHDLIHKAVGWMLREIGKRDKKVLEDFLKFHYKNMPRTMLRYAIEKFPEEKRKKYLAGNI